MHTSPQVLDAAARQAAVDHLNHDHPEDTLLLCRVLGGLGEARAARAVDLDEEGLELQAELPQGTRRLRLAFSSPVTERAQVRARVVELYRHAQSEQAQAGPEGGR